MTAWWIRQARKRQPRNYLVWMAGMVRVVELQADDVCLEETGGHAYWNFYVRERPACSATVAAFPFSGVEYIVSVDG